MKKKSTFKRIFQLMGKGFPIYLSSLIIVSLISLATQGFIAQLFNKMFEAIKNADINDLIHSVEFYVVLITLLMLFTPIFSYLLNREIANTTGKIRKYVFNKLGRLPLKYYKNRHSGDLVSRMTNDVSVTEKIYNQYFVDLITWLITGIGSIILSFLYDWRLALVTVASAGISLLVNLYYAKILRVLGKGIQEKLAKLTETLTNLLDGMPIIRSFNLQRMIINKFRRNNQNVYDASMDRVKIRAIVDGLNVVVGFLSFSCIAAVGSYLVITGQMEFGVIVAIVQLQNGPRVLVQILGSFITNIQASLACGDRIFEVMDEEDEPIKYDLEIKSQPSHYLIEMKELSFQYEQEKVLDHLSLQIPQGKVVAFVGPSGGGKSTLFKILLNFYQPSDGDLMIGGKSISEQKIKEIRELFAYVPQDAYLFSGTIADNIKQGNENATMEDVIKAAKTANADNFIQTLEDGYETQVGERGTQLSGGQRQRIAIARAILKNAPILLLDEATSALDTESELLVQEAIEKLMKGKTTLVIAHRLSTIQNADEIMVLSEGHIVEKGKHNELLERNGLYKNLYERQFKLSVAN